MASEELGPGQMYGFQAKKAYRGIAASQTEHHHRDPLVPSSHGCLAERKGRRGAKLAAEETDGRMARVLGPGGGAVDDAPQFPTP